MSTAAQWAFPFSGANLLRRAKGAVGSQ